MCCLSELQKCQWTLLMGWHSILLAALQKSSKNLPQRDFGWRQPQWSRTLITKGSSSPCQPSTAASPCGGEQDLPWWPRQQSSRAGTFPAVAALPAPCSRDWSHWWWELCPQRLWSHSIFQTTPKMAESWRVPVTCNTGQAARGRGKCMI